LLTIPKELFVLFEERCVPKVSRKHDKAVQSSVHILKKKNKIKNPQKSEKNGY